MRVDPLRHAPCNLLLRVGDVLRALIEVVVHWARRAHALGVKRLEQHDEFRLVVVLGNDEAAVLGDFRLLSLEAPPGAKSET